MEVGESEGVIALARRRCSEAAAVTTAAALVGGEREADEGDGDFVGEFGGEGGVG